VVSGALAGNIFSCFSTPFRRGPADPNNWIIDDLSFSPQAIPEPNTLELFLVGGMMFGLRRWRRRGKSSIS